MKIEPIQAFYDNYIWAIINDRESSAICVDPGDSTPVIKFLQKRELNLKAIIITHHHADHIAGVASLVKYYPDAEVYGPVDRRIDFITHEVKEGDYVNLSHLDFPLQFVVMETPGHTSTHICYYEARNSWLFCGDTLFSGGCGRIFDSSIEALFNSLQRLKNLPEETLVYSAHEYTEQNLRFASLVEPNNKAVKDYMIKLQNTPVQCTLPSTIAREKQINPFFRTNETEIAQNTRQISAKNTGSEFEVFVAIRRQKDGFS